MRLPPLPTITDIVRLYKLKARKQLSQNFLLDMNIAKKIVRYSAHHKGPVKNKHVIEVGPGPGGISRAILEAGAKELVVVEKDPRFLPGLQLLNDASENKVRIFCDDILHFNMEGLFPTDANKEWHDKRLPDISVIGNLPFNVSTPLIVKWLEQISNRTGIWKYGRVPMTLTFQKEVGERMVAPILGNQRSRLSIMTQYLCEVSHQFTIPGKAFVPQPDVDVAVMHLVPRKEQRINVPFPIVEKVVRHIFHHRQKMCKRGIQTLFPPDKPELTSEMIRLAGVEPESRSFMLSIEEFSRLCEAYSSLCDQHSGLWEYYFREQQNAAEWRANKQPLLI